jgi:hypothetical protein
MLSGFMRITRRDQGAAGNLSGFDTNWPTGVKKDTPLSTGRVHRVSLRSCWRSGFTTRGLPTT